MSDDANDNLTGVMGIAAVGVCAAAFGTHVYVCIKGAMWTLLIVGAIVFPIGIIHGVGRWFEWWW